MQYLSQGAQQTARIINKREAGLLSTGWSHFEQMITLQSSNVYSWQKSSIDGSFSSKLWLITVSTRLNRNQVIS